MTLSESSTLACKKVEFEGHIRYFIISIHLKDNTLIPQYRYRYQPSAIPLWVEVHEVCLNGCKYRGIRGITRSTVYSEVRGKYFQSEKIASNLQI